MISARAHKVGRYEVPRRLRSKSAGVGHSTITMTMRYAHLAPNDGGDMRRALDRAAQGHGSNRAAAAPEPVTNAAS